MDINIQKILAYSIDETMTPSQLRNAENFSEFFKDEKNIQKTESLQSRMKTNNIIGFLESDSIYPSQFSSIKNPPSIIYAMGNLDLLQKNIIGVVGPREMSQYGNQVMQGLFDKIANTNLVTVSGMARGVDHLCHQLSMDSNLSTIAVLGGGLRYYRNSSARSFMQKIIEKGGLILSEFKLDFKPTPWSFPQRNRLISALSKCLFLPEAREGSGSLITADFAYQQHKKIFVAPSPIFSENGIGANSLVSKGKAVLLSDYNQILQFFEINNTTQNTQKSASSYKKQTSLTDEEKSLLSIISKYQNQDFSLRLHNISSDFGEALMKITDLEMKGYIQQTIPGCYAIEINIK